MATAKFHSNHRTFRCRGEMGTVAQVQTAFPQLAPGLRSAWSQTSQRDGGSFGIVRLAQE
jgi:hypothetical protein